MTHTHSAQQIIDALDGVNLSELPDDVMGELMQLLTISPDAPALVTDNDTPNARIHAPLSPWSLNYRAEADTEHFVHALDHAGTVLEAMLNDPWMRVGASQKHRDGTHAALHTWRTHMMQVHTALVALTQLIDATPGLITEDGEPLP